MPIYWKCDRCHKEFIDDHEKPNFVTIFSEEFGHFVEQVDQIPQGIWPQDDGDDLWLCTACLAKMQPVGEGH